MTLYNISMYTFMFWFPLHKIAIVSMIYDCPCFSVNVMIITSGFPTVGEIYTLKCSVTGSIDQPTITWLDDSGVITSSDTTMNPSGSYSSNLTFTPLSASDTGMIMCRATLGDSMQTASIVVTVEGKCSISILIHSVYLYLTMSSH